MVDIKAHHLTEGALSDRRMTSVPPTPLGVASAPAPKMPQTDRATVSVQTAISIRAQIYQAFSSLRLSLETLTGAKKHQDRATARKWRAGRDQPGCIVIRSSHAATRHVPDHRCEICPICATGDDLAATCWPRQTVHRHHRSHSCDWRWQGQFEIPCPKPEWPTRPEGFAVADKAGSSTCCQKPSGRGACAATGIGRNPFARPASSFAAPRPAACGVG